MRLRRTKNRPTKNLRAQPRRSAGRLDAAANASARKKAGRPRLATGCARTPPREGTAALPTSWIRSCAAWSTWGPPCIPATRVRTPQNPTTRRTRILTKATSARRARTTTRTRQNASGGYIFSSATSCVCCATRMEVRCRTRSPRSRRSSARAASCRAGFARFCCIDRDTSTARSAARSTQRDAPPQPGWTATRRRSGRRRGSGGTLRLTRGFCRLERPWWVTRSREARVGSGNESIRAKRRRRDVRLRRWRRSVWICRPRLLPTRARRCLLRGTRRISRRSVSSAAARSAESRSR